MKLQKPNSPKRTQIKKNSKSLKKHKFIFFAADKKIKPPKTAKVCGILKANNIKILLIFPSGGLIYNSDFLSFLPLKNITAQIIANVRGKIMEKAKPTLKLLSNNAET